MSGLTADGLLREGHEFDLAIVESVANAVVDLIVSRGLAGRDAVDPRLEDDSDSLVPSTSGETVKPHDGVPRCVPDLSYVFLPGWAKVERDFIEAGYVVLDGFKNCLGIVRDFHGHPKCGIGASISDGDGLAVFIGLEGPRIFDKISGQTELSRTDIAACLGYLVCLLGDAVCLFGPGDGSPGSLISNLGEAVRLLRDTVRCAGLEKAHDTNGAGHAPDNQRDDSTSIHDSSLSPAEARAWRFTPNPWRPWTSPGEPDVEGRRYV